MAKPLETAEIELRTHSTLHDERGRFLGKIRAGIEGAFKEMAEDGEAHAIEHQPPPGKKPDPRSAPISESFYSGWDSDSAWWGNSARHALAVEEGTRRHFQTGRVSFFWEEEGRRWVPGPNQIDHPATGAKPFLRPSYYHVARNYKDYLKRHLDK